jgi:hypothetical protein
MKLKKSVNILGHEYKVFVLPPSKMPANVAGLCEYPQRTIKLSSELKGEMLWLVLLHECRHAFHYEGGMTQIIHPQVQEIDCESFASFVSSLKKQGVI